MRSEVPKPLMDGAPPWPCGRGLLLAALLPVMACDPGANVDAPSFLEDPPPSVGEAPAQTEQAPLLALSMAPDEPALPLSNATLAVSSDGTVVATDADRDQIYMVSPGELSLRTIVLEPGDAPGRVSVGLGRAFVSSRRGPWVFEVELDSGAVTRHQVCGSPQGLAIDAANVLQIACRDGTLLGLDPDSDSVMRTLRLDDDLRDVLAVGQGLVVSRFRSAELLQLDASGSVVFRVRPARSEAAVPGVAWRTIVLPDGRLAMAHQMMSTGTIQGFSATLGSYGGSCGAISAATLSVIDLAAPEQESPSPDPGARYTVWRSSVLGVAGTLDIASPDGVRLYVTSPGNMLDDGLAQRSLTNGTVGSPINFGGGLSESSLVQTLVGDASTCSSGEPIVTEGAVVAVAILSDGRRVIQKREPAELEIEGGGVVRLAEKPLHNAGLTLFQMSTSRAISCASCHPEGRDDGHTWTFGDVGYRRTPSLEGGVTAHAPFHWNGELPTLHTLLDEVMARRMGLLATFSDAQVERLGTFLDGVPAQSGAYAVDAAASERGRALFESAETECTLCHRGPTLTDNELHDVGTGGEFVTPPLIGLASRAPFLHDGCAQTLRERFGRCGGSEHGHTDQLTEVEIDDLIAYLESL